jgi:predicted component of type VI protein secretion system
MNRRSFVVLTLFAVILLLAACQSAANVQSGYLDQTPRVVVISVFDEEMRFFPAVWQ